MANSFHPVQSSSIGFFKQRASYPLASPSVYQDVHGIREPEGFSERSAIVFLAVNPQEELFRFAEKIHGSYDVYVMIDNNDFSPPPTKVTVLKYPLGEAEAIGYSGCVLWVKDRASSRCKALYHFAHKDKSYDKVWMIEEDVFIPSKKTISHLDELYPSGDLLCTAHVINSTGELESWPWWEKLKGNIELPWAKSMISSIRVSRAMLQSIDDYVVKNKKLLFDEAVFNTLAMHSKLKIVNPPELTDIVYWNRQWDLNEFKPFHMYHPVKQWKQHNAYKTQMGMEFYSDMNA